MRKIIIFVVLAVVLGGIGYWYWHSRSGPRTVFRTAEVTKGRLQATISATGTLQPEEVVDVGAQVAGRVLKLGDDPSVPGKIIIWGSMVQAPEVDKDGKILKEGTLLAEIDPAIYKAQVEAAQADLDAKKADVRVKEALKDQAKADFDRAVELKKTKSIAPTEYDAAVATKDTTLANFILSKAQVGVSQAQLDLARTNLAYTKIYPPVNGVIIDRRVNVGQTVVASLSAPSLFLIAKDLTKMEIWATVNEVDVGKIEVGQKVKFTVDAYPGHKPFKGEVKAQGKYPARLNASMTQNVVTYTVVVSADNSDGLLWPYLTANLSFIVKDVKDALLVPNAALRWQPSRNQIDPASQEAYTKMKGSKKKTATDTEGQDLGIVWVKTSEGFVRPIQLHIGLSDMIHTEVLEPVPADFHDGLEVVTGEGRSQADAGGANPFIATPFGGKKKDQ